MSQNPILDELHLARQAILERCHGDTAAYLRESQRRLLAAGRTIAKRPQRRIHSRAERQPPARQTEGNR